MNKTRKDKFSKYDIGRGLSALWNGHDRAEISRWATPALAATIFRSTGVYPYNPNAIDRTNLRTTLALPEESPGLNELLLSGPSLFTQRRTQAPDAQAAALLASRMQVSELQAANAAMHEELLLYRGMVRSGEAAGSREPRCLLVMSKGLMTAHG